MYASEQSFGGQRASVGRVILTRRGESSELQPCIITRIRPGDIIDARSAEDGREVWFTADTFTCRTSADVGDMPCGAWCWPPRA
jgi:hypothetical protein